MVAADPARVVLVSSLLVLGLSVAAFANVAGVTSAMTTDTAGTFAVDDGALTFARGDGTETTIVTDVRDLERIEITDGNGGVSVTTEPRDTPTLSEHHRRLAKRTVLSNETIADRLETTGGATLTVLPIRVGERPRDRTTVAAIAPERDRRARADGVGDPVFETRSNGSNGAIMVARNASAIRDDLALVIVEPVGTNAAYRTVIDLESESVDRMLRLEVVAE
ncbi:hypothetical protein [Natrinema pallidum]|uniref:Uncharacterized protein n=1 Tax=Natrinema pallidum DSM 3751 TaxID=1227495 RepID=L9YNC3_9EURY|nr:hypothetical protein [Natrinema pallidum]ELY75161.1 hypothetical protein C487_13457 [Natrinema pallidum DSM 3751]